MPSLKESHLRYATHFDDVLSGEGNLYDQGCPAAFLGLGTLAAVLTSNSR